MSMVNVALVVPQAELDLHAYWGSMYASGLPHLRAYMSDMQGYLPDARLIMSMVTRRAVTLARCVCVHD